MRVVPRRRPSLGRGVGGDVVQLAIVEEQGDTGRDQNLEHSAKFFCWCGRAGHRLFDRLDRGTHRFGADGLADRLLGIEELVDVGLGKADGLGQVRDGRLLVTETAEVFVRRLDDLVSNRVIGRAARMCGGGRGFAHEETIPRFGQLDN